jgi:hypothetical protein
MVFSFWIIYMVTSNHIHLLVKDTYFCAGSDRRVVSYFAFGHFTNWDIDRYKVCAKTGL